MTDNNDSQPRHINTTVGSWRLHGTSVSAAVKVREPASGRLLHCRLVIEDVGLRGAERYLIGRLTSASYGDLATVRIPAPESGLRLTDVERWLREYAPTSVELADYLDSVRGAAIRH